MTLWDEARMPDPDNPTPAQIKAQSRILFRVLVGWVAALLLVATVAGYAWLGVLLVVAVCLVTLVQARR